MADPTQFTLIIPAHNEERVIQRCLRTALEGAPEGHSTQVIVAANGCVDRTVQEARQAAPDALVLDIEEGSKTRAMNAGHEHAKYYPRIFLDADVQCNYHSLLALAEALRQPGVKAGSPALRMDLSRSSWLIKAYYRVWLTQPYVKRAMVGSGCFGLSREGHECIGPFPAITGDDIWVHSRFREGERVNISRDIEGRPVTFLVSPPRRLSDQLRVETRRRLGNEEVRQRYPSPHYAGSNSLSSLLAARAHGATLLDIGIYLGVKVLAKLRMTLVQKRRKEIVWERDEAAREA